MNALTAAPPAVTFLAAAVLAATAGRRRALVAGVAAAALALAWLLLVPAGVHLRTQLFGFEVALFAVDSLSRPVGAVFAFVGAANVAYAHGTGASVRQTAGTLAYVGAAVGAVFAGDWLTLFVWWELLAVAATALVWQSPGAVRAGYRYALYHQLGGAALAAGVLLHYTRTGTFVFGDALAGLPLLLVVLGAGLNAGFLGLHVWLVDTYPRPHVATSAVLCGFTTKVGVYALARALPGQRLAVAYLGGAMVLVGVTLAVLQTDLRRLLTYHVVSQVGYMVAGVGLGTAAGRAGGVAHLVNNVLYKTLLFMVAGVLVVETGREHLGDLGGLAGRLPATAVAFAVAAFAIAGVPGFAGFVSKGFVTSAAQKAGTDALWWALQLGAVGTIVSFAKFGYYAFLRDAPDDPPDSEASVGRSATVALAVLAVPCVALGVAPGLLARGVPTGASATGAFAASKLAEAAVILAAGVALFAALRPVLSHVSPVPDLDAVYHPVGAFCRDAGSRATTRLASVLDRAANRTVATLTGAVTDPDALRSVGVGPATIGTSVLLVAVVAALALLAFVLA